MPMSGSNYVAPTWVNNAPPALDAAELQAMCNTIQENQSDAAALQAALQALTTTVNGKSRVQLISYVGTGTVGEDNPCSITADFPIQVAIMTASSTGSSFVSYAVSMVGNALTTSYKNRFGFYAGSGSIPCYGKKSSDGKTFFWYVPSPSAEWGQFNESRTTYYVLCFGQ